MLTHTHSDTHARTHTLVNTHTHTHTHIHSPTHLHTHSHSLSHTHVQFRTVNTRILFWVLWLIISSKWVRVSWLEIWLIFSAVNEFDSVSKVNLLDDALNRNQTHWTQYESGWVECVKPQRWPARQHWRKTRPRAWNVNPGSTVCFNPSRCCRQNTHFCWIACDKLRKSKSSTCPSVCTTLVALSIRDHTSHRDGRRKEYRTHRYISHSPVQSTRVRKRKAGGRA